MTELAIDVFVSEVIHNAKWAARTNPINTMIRRFEREREVNSSLIFFRRRAKGTISNVVNKRRYNAMVSGWVGSLNSINMAANETATIDVSRATYGFFISKGE